MAGPALSTSDNTAGHPPAANEKEKKKGEEREEEKIKKKIYRKTKQSPRGPAHLINPRPSIHPSNRPSSQLILLPSQRKTVSQAKITHTSGGEWRVTGHSAAAAVRQYPTAKDKNKKKTQTKLFPSAKPPRQQGKATQGKTSTCGPSRPRSINTKVVVAVDQQHQKLWNR